MRTALVCLAIPAAVASLACAQPAVQPSPAPVVQLQGAGATFPQPFYDRAFFAYRQKDPGVAVNYQPNGSGAGIGLITGGTIDFGASDVPLSPAEIAAAGGTGTLVQLPTTVGVVAIAYNLPGVDRLQLDGATLARIFLGAITRWDDQRIAALNGGVRLPGVDITVVHRSDGSGTTYAFTDYLSKISATWKAQVGTSKAVAWPTGVGASGNANVGQQVQTTPGAIGYVELAYVIESRLQQAFLKNAAGVYLQASVKGAAAAATSLADVSPTSFSITNAATQDAYPIASFSWVIMRLDQADPTRGRALVRLWRWVVTDGQSQGKDLQYAALSRSVQAFSISQLAKVTSRGKPLS